MGWKVQKHEKNVKATKKHAKVCINLQKCVKRVKVDNNSKKYNKMINRQKLPKNEPKLAKTGENGQEQAKTCE